MAILLYTVHIVVSLFLILVVLLQQGKGADLSVFGGGGTMTAFGARGAASVLHKFTVGGFIVFICTTLAIGVYQSDSSDNVLSTLPAAAATDPDAAAEAAAEALTGVLPEAESFSGTEGDTAEDGTAEPTEGEPTTEGDATSDAPASDATTPDTGANDTNGSGN